MRRVVITGVGLITALGTGAAENWQKMIGGQSAVAPIRAFDASTLHTRLGAEIADFDPLRYVSNRRSLRMMTRNDQLALAGATLAVEDSGLNPADEDPERFGLFVGSNKEVSNPMHLLEGTLAARRPDGSVDMHILGESGNSAFYPLFYVEGLQAASLFYISHAYGLKGPNTYFAGTAEAGATAIGRAFRAVRNGEADVALAGGFDDATSWWNMTKFDALGLMTDRNDLGTAACKPYDRDRSGTVMGEGAAMLLLEERQSAERRGARMYAELTGFGIGFDAYKLLTPHPQGRGLTHAVHAALREADTVPEAFGYAATHGNGTVLGDESEAGAIQATFGDGSGGLAASTVTPATGYLVAAAGALNAAVAALALHHQLAPPALNLTTPDSACELDWVRGEAREIRFDQALAIARGLDGQNVALTMRAAG
jgi:3-oxoacyl-[acyl-carrier-protein] synthase II